MTTFLKMTIFIKNVRKLIVKNSLDRYPSQIKYNKLKGFNINYRIQMPNIIGTTFADIDIQILLMIHIDINI